MNVRGKWEVVGENLEGWGFSAAWGGVGKSVGVLLGWLAWGCWEAAWVCVCVDGRYRLAASRCRTVQYVTVTWDPSGNMLVVIRLFFHPPWLSATVSIGRNWLMSFSKRVNLTFSI